MSNLAIFLILCIGAYLLFQKYKKPQNAASLDFLPDTFIVVDLETTGLFAARHEIIEIAAIKCKKGSDTHAAFQSLVMPKKAIPNEIVELTGITQQMVEAEGKSLEEAMREFADFAGNLRLVTFNSAFDMAFIEAAAKKCNMQPFQNPVSCALKMSRRAWPGRKSYRLEDLATDGNIKKGLGHRALEDARRALIVYVAAVAKLRLID